MQSSFLNETLQQLLQEDIDLAQTTFILPSKRAGSFLKELLKTQTDYSGFAPEIFSIEAFISKIAELKNLDNPGSIFSFYEVYRQLTPAEELEDFETFYGWAQTLVYDFNEIDRYLIPTQDFFSYLSDIQQIDHWALADPQTELVANYLKFWKRLPEYHAQFVALLLQNKEGYQGLAYRQASEKIDSFLARDARFFVFIGFNALNAAEQKIIQRILERERGRIFWDIDAFFIENAHHEAGYFIRKHQKEWAYFKEHQMEGISNHYTTEKKIQVIGVSKNIGQAKAVGEILQKEPLARTAVVLNDEGLLIPLLNSLPDKVNEVNITMGLSLKMTPVASLFEILFTLQKETQNGLYYKNVLELLSHPTVKRSFPHIAHRIRPHLIEKNQVFVRLENLLTLTDDPQERAFLSCCFTPYQNDAKKFLAAMIDLLQLLRPEDAEPHKLEVEYLFHFNRVFVKLSNLLGTFSSVSQLKTLYRLYQDALKMETIDFEGSPFEGLQIMGMLETRVLDYDTLIMTSVNEGILPSGKSTNSFLPYDLKKAYRLPTYREKDAVYTYHFYRLLQRAKKVYLLYNTEKSGFNAGEKSRFITQLEVEKPASFHFQEDLRSSPVVQTQPALKVIPKTPEIIDLLKKQAQKGFSPSALTTYIRNPIDFYKHYILGIKEADQVEETIAANTLGTVVHGALENFYKPLQNRTLHQQDLLEMRAKIEQEVQHQFQVHYQAAKIDKGKNLIIKEVAHRFLFNFLNREIQEVKKGKDLRILMIESHELQEELQIDELNFPVFLRGIVDRVDQKEGELRIVDYKTGAVDQSALKPRLWEDLVEDPKYSKAFQVLCYSSMVLKKMNQPSTRAGIICFRNLGKGFMPFELKSEKKQQIDKDMLLIFHALLKTLILEIFDPEIPFVEKEI